MSIPRIPRIFRALVSALVPLDQRDTVVGDLDEEFFERRVPDMGVATATQWYRRECLSVAMSFARERLSPGRRPGTPRKVRPEMRSLLNDVRFGFRALIKQPVSAVMSILILSVGIGLSTSMFTIMYGVLLRPLDFPEADRLTMIFETDLRNDDEQRSVPIHDFFDWRESQRSFEGLFAYYGSTINVSGTGEDPERYRGAYVTANTFAMLRVQPLMGRLFQEGDDAPGASPIVVLGYDMWNGHFRGDADVLGRTLRINGTTATVVGVMPEEFGFPGGQSIWIPMSVTPNDVERGERHLEVMGRLADGVTLEQAQLEIASIARGLESEFPETNEGIGVRFMTFSENATPLDDFGKVFLVMMAAGLLVLLVACANVANILLAKAAMRTKEAAIRTAMGGSRFRVVLPFFSEALGLAAFSAILGIGLAYLAVGAFDSATRDIRPFFIEFVIDAPILLYVVAVAMFTALAAGAFPSWQVVRADVNLMLKDESRGTSSLRMGRISKMLVVGEVALSCLLLVGAGLMARSMKSIGDVDFAFDPENLLTARVLLPSLTYDTEDKRRTFSTDLITRLEAHPQIAAAAISSSTPGLGGGSRSIRLEGEAFEEERDLPEAGVLVVSPGFFETLGIPPIMGRGFEERHAADQPPVAVVARNFADRFFPDINPVGQRFHAGPEDEGEWLTVIGVAPDIGLEGLSAQFGDSVSYYVSSLQNDMVFMLITARPSAGEAIALAAPIRETVRSIDNDLPIYEEELMAGVLDQVTFLFNTFGTLFVAFGVVTLTMAIVGLYGVLSFSVTSRMQELGVRIALGARAGDVVRLIMRQGGMQIAVGMVLGLAGAMGVTKFLGVFLYDVNPRDPIVFGGVALIVATTGVLAMLVPARRASVVDPMVALRSE